MTSRLLLAPSILSADFGRLQAEVESVTGEADWLQVDVMDGHFVPNLSFGAPVLRSLKTTLPLDIHLMVSNPADRLAEFVALKEKGLNISHMTFHAEAVTASQARHALIRQIKESGLTAGIALKPGTPVEEIDDVVGSVDLVLVMTVEPGFGGQAFLPETLPKVAMLRAAHPTLMIQVDGGINAQTAAQARAAGADNLVAGSFVFSAADRLAALKSLRS